MQTSLRSFESIEQLDALPRELGWPLEYRQLEAGVFSSTFADLEGDTWFLMEEQSRRSVEVVAGAPEGMFMLALLEGAPLTVNNQLFGANQVLLQTPGSDFRAVAPANTKVIQLGIAADLVDEVIQAVVPDLEIAHRSVSVLDTSAGSLIGLRIAMREALYAPSHRAHGRDEAASGILAGVLAVASEQGALKQTGILHRKNSQRVLDRAKEYIEAHVGEAIRVESMCQYSGTSLRSLERLFTRDLGVSPQQYIRARRFNAVRRRLLATNAGVEACVTEVAQDHGFAHLGRFAGDYRRYFGELPSETLLSRA